MSNYPPYYGQIRTIHFVGIGGIGMSGIAEVLLGHKLNIQGSDLNESQTVLRLKGLGAKVFIGHHESNLKGADLVVVSSAIGSKNPEVCHAKNLGIPVIPRAIMLAELMRLKHGIAIAGSHGKTTTTSLVATILDKAQLDPTVIIGGKVNQMGSNARLGKGDFLVAEADESDGSFLHLSPSLSAITNIDPEHLDFYKGGLEEIKEKFIAFGKKLPFYGLLAACFDDENVQAVLPKIKRRTVTYGLKPGADLQAHHLVHDGLSTRFEATYKGKELGLFHTSMVGAHNVQNALCAIVLALELSIPIEKIKEALAEFRGVERRFTVVGQVNDTTIIDDYAHHPTEIKAVLQAAKQSFSGKKIRVLFQPHRYSRTQDLLGDFAHAFFDADHVIVSDIYAASESAIKGINGQTLADAISAAGHPNAAHEGSLQNCSKSLLNEIGAGEIVMTLGAGNITHVAPQIFSALQKSWTS